MGRFVEPLPDWAEAARRLPHGDPVQVKCEDCDGTGRDAFGELDACDICGGWGYVVQHRRAIKAKFEISNLKGQSNGDTEREPGRGGQQRFV